MKGAKQRLKRVIGLMLALTMTLSMVLPAYAITDDYGILTYTDDPGLRYEAVTFDADGKPFLTDDGSLMMHIYGYDKYTDSYGYSTQIRTIDPKFQEAYENFYRALRFATHNQEYNDTASSGLTGNIEWDSQNTSTYSMTIYNDQSSLNYNPYSPKNYDYATDPGTGEDLAKAELDLFVSDLKGIGWAEFNSVIDYVFKNNMDDIMDNYSSESTTGVFCTFIDKVWEKLKADGIIALQQEGAGKYSIKKFTYDNSITSEPIAVERKRITQGYSQTISEAEKPVSDQKELSAGGFVGFTATGEYDQGRDVYMGDYTAPGIGFNKYTSNTFWNCYSGSSHPIKVYPLFGKIGYSNKRYVDYKTSEYMLFDFCETYALTTPDTEYINKEVVTKLNVGDVLAPGSVIIHGYDTDDKRFYLSKVFGVSDDKTMKHVKAPYQNYSSDTCGSVTYYTGSYWDGINYFTFTEDESTLPTLSNLKWNTYSVGNTYKTFYFNRYEYDYEKGIYKLYGEDTAAQIKYEITFDLTEASNGSGKRIMAYGPDVCELLLESTSSDDIYVSYSDAIDESEGYITHVKRNAHTSVTSAASDKSALNYTLSYYASRMPIEEDVQGYRIVDIKTVDEKDDNYYGNYDNNNTVVYIQVERINKISSHTVTFVTNGDTQIDPQTVEDGEQATKPADPSKTGHDFDKWYSDTELTKEYDFTTPVIEDITLYGAWTKKNYTVSFNSLGGTSVSSQTISYNDVAKKPENPTRTGYDFNRWNNDKEGNNEYNFNTPVIENKELFASWDKKEYTVKFNSNGGTRIEDQKVKYEEKAVKPSDPEKTGHVFGSWYLDEELTKEYDFATPVTDNIELFASWDKNEYTVSFNSLGGSVVESQKVKYEEKAKEPEKPTRTGYDFGKWHIDEGLKAEYNFDTPVTNNIELFASWDKKEYTVKFHSNGGTSISDQTVKYEDKAIKPGDPEKTGCNFGTWYTDEDLTKEYDFDTPVKDNLDLYASWDEKIYTVTFHSNGGTEIESQKVKHGNKAEEPEDPEREYYEFVKWCSDEGLTEEYDFDSDIVQDTNIYALWEPIKTATYEISRGKGGDGVHVNAVFNDINYTIFSLKGGNGGAPDDKGLDCVFDSDKLYKNFMELRAGNGVTIKNQEKIIDGKTIFKLRKLIEGFDEAPGEVKATRLPAIRLNYNRGENPDPDNDIIFTKYGLPDQYEVQCLPVAHAAAGSNMKVPIEWNTKSDGTGKAYKPGEPISGDEAFAESEKQGAYILHLYAIYEKSKTTMNSNYEN